MSKYPDYLIFCDFENLYLQSSEYNCRTEEELNGEEPESTWFYGYNEDNENGMIHHADILWFSALPYNDQYYKRVSTIEEAQTIITSLEKELKNLKCGDLKAVEKLFKIFEFENSINNILN